MESEGGTDDLTKSSSSGSGRMEKAIVNVAADWSGDLQEPNDRNCPQQGNLEAGYHRCHGECALVNASADEISDGTLCTYRDLP